MVREDPARDLLCRIVRLVGTAPLTRLSLWDAWSTYGVFMLLVLRLCLGYWAAIQDSTLWRRRNLAVRSRRFLTCPQSVTPSADAGDKLR